MESEGPSAIDTENEVIYSKLCENSLSAFWAAIEIHNKPHFRFRYEVVIILIINAWELLLKAQILRYHPSIKVIGKDGKSKTFDECLGTVFSNLPKEFIPTRENLAILQEFRNTVAHFYSSELDIIIFSLIHKNVQFYSKFANTFFNIDLSQDSDLILLPIGFKKFISPVDYLSNESNLKGSSEIVKSFINTLTSSIKTLYEKGIEDSIIVDYVLYFESVRNVKNSDLIVRIDPESKLGMEIKKKLEVGVLTNNPYSPVVHSRSFSIPPTTETEEVISWIALKDKDNTFLPSEESLWKKYLKRKELCLTKEQIIVLVKFSIMQNIAVFYWLGQLSSHEIMEAIDECLSINTDAFIRSTCAKILNIFPCAECRAIVRKYKLSKQQLNTIKGITIDGDIQMRITSLRKDFGVEPKNPLFSEKLEIILNDNIVRIVKNGNKIDCLEARRDDQLLFLITHYSELIC